MIPIFHADHGLGESHKEFVRGICARQQSGEFFIGLFELPGELESLPSGLHGPILGDSPVTEDEVEYITRSQRPGPSRLCRRPTRPVRDVVVCGIGGEGGRIFTAYGSQVLTPREWWDTSMTPAQARESAAFWELHALSAE